MVTIMKAHGGWVTGSRESGNRFVTHATWLGHSAPVQGRLKLIAASLTSDPSLRLDLLQEALLHLWQIQRERPGQTLAGICKAAGSICSMSWTAVAVLTRRSVADSPSNSG